MQINGWRHQQGGQSWVVAVRSEDQFLLAFWRAECEAQGDEAHSEPILWIAGHQEIAIPEWEEKYILVEDPRSGHSSVDVFREDDMPVFIVIVTVLVRVLHLVGIVRHLI